MEKQLYEYWVIVLYGDMYDNDTMHRQIWATDDAAAWGMAEFIVANMSSHGYPDPCINGLFQGRWLDKPQG